MMMTWTMTTMNVEERECVRYPTTQMIGTEMIEEQYTYVLSRLHALCSVIWSSMLSCMVYYLRGFENGGGPP